MQGKIVLPKIKKNNTNNQTMAVTVAANFISMGFPMTTEMIKHLAKAEKQDIIDFYESYYSVFSEVVGADKKLTPFYPDFPEKCMERSAVHYWIDQIIYGLSGLMIEPRVYMKEKETFPFIGQPIRRVLMEGSEEDLQHVFTLAVQSTIAYSKEQREFMLFYINEYPETMNILKANKDTKNRENAVTCACMLEELSGDSAYTADFMKQPTDLLRYAAFHSEKRDGKDGYPAISLRYSDEMPRFIVSRPVRRQIMDCFVEMANKKGGTDYLTKNMQGHKKEWKRLFKSLHIQDGAWAAKKYQPVQEAMFFVMSGKKNSGLNGKIEEAIKADDLDNAVAATMKKPGEFMRRFDKLYRMGIEHGKEELVLESMKKTAEKAGIATVTGVIGNIEKRNQDEKERYFKGKSGKVVVIKNKNRKGFTESEINDAVKTAMTGLIKKMENKEPIGKVYMSESLADVKIPVDIRDDSSSINALTTGSKMPIPNDWEIIRFYVGWTNLPGHSDDTRVDIDLTVAFCDKDMNIVEFCGWDGSYKGKGYVYSGDVRNGGPSDGKGRGEYVDIYLNEIKKRGIRYAIPQVSSFTNQKFSEQPNTCFGVMKRTSLDKGRVFEPAAIMNRFVLDAAVRQFTPYIIDLESMEVLWISDSTQETIASRSLATTLKQVKRASSSKTMSLSRLIEANVMATGEFVNTPKEADVIFIRDVEEMTKLEKELLISEGDKNIILSNNMEYITGYLMKEKS